MRRWQELQPVPAPMCRRTSETLRNSSVTSADSKSSSVTRMQWHTIGPPYIWQPPQSAPRSQPFMIANLVET